jgi:hypothetical protein
MKKDQKCIKVYVSTEEYTKFKEACEKKGESMNRLLRKGILNYIAPKIKELQ